ncbi:MAG: DUF2786 domain-containing protein [Treponema sp.]|jgi:hypothetical protein|nr:DUF2786 domain-containing protein [Treponema sp.]
MGELEKIKSKLKKLFALSRSPNANEAALALEMAQKLMIEHGIKRNDVGEFEVIENDIKGSGNERPPVYEVHLTSNIATAFGCQLAYGWHKGHESEAGYIRGWYGHTFVGLEHRVQIACFIAEVLLRKMKNARTNYTKQLTRVRSRTNKIKRADEFCLGWSCTVVDKLNLFTNTDDEQKAIDNYVANLKWSNKLKTISRGGIKKSGINDFANGRKVGAGVEIQSGIGGNDSGALLLER